MKTTPPISKRRPRGPKKQLIAPPKDQRGLDPASASCSNDLIMMGSMSSEDRQNLLAEIKRNLVRFITKAWNDDEECHKFNVFGDLIFCVKWNDQHFITGNDIVKAQLALYRLHFGRLPADRRKFEEGIYSDLRHLRPGIDSVLEEANSPFLVHLFRLGCVKTHKRQKVFCWSAVNHLQIHEEVIRRELKRTQGESDHPLAVEWSKNRVVRPKNPPLLPMSAEGEDSSSPPNSWNHNSNVSSPTSGSANLPSRLPVPIKWLYLPYYPARIESPKPAITPAIKNLIDAVDILDSKV